MCLPANTPSWGPVRLRTLGLEVSYLGDACEHLFVTPEGRAYSRFKRALASGNAMVSWAAALELEAITLHDALALLLLVGDSDQARYEKAAMRWHARLCHEGRLSMSEAQLALSALHARCRRTASRQREPSARSASSTSSLKPPWCSRLGWRGRGASCRPRRLIVGSG